MVMKIRPITRGGGRRDEKFLHPLEKSVGQFLKLLNIV